MCSWVRVWFGVARSCCRRLHTLLDQYGISSQIDVRWKVDAHSPRLMYDDMGDRGFASFQERLTGSTAFAKPRRVARACGSAHAEWRNLPAGTEGLT